ncbi:FecR family protein [Desertivirga xinjiangensis]|uniref:FecR family protein n=1 Tax=Desertivirga xinjiangensis TaxID=539206 RepID=UPI00210E1E43|nr:FecR domain-containing protein [Pedobacter xinjiangensis]
MTENNRRKILKKYINQQCSSAELKVVRQLLKRRSGKAELERLLDEDWAGFSDSETADETLIRWKSRFFYQKRLNERFKSKNLYSFISYAAAACVVLACFTLFWQSKVNRYSETKSVKLIEKYNPAGQRSKILLPDSSVVYLGPASCLSFPEEFNESKRELSLEGEAFFEVRKDVKRPFTVHTGRVRTRVLGTSFKVDSRERDVIVSVATGKVRVSVTDGTKTTPLAELLPGSRISFNQLSRVSIGDTVAPYELVAWKEGKIFFNNTPLKSIAEQLQYWYGVKILVNDAELEKYRFTLSVNAMQPLGHVMEIIASTANINYSISGNKTVLIQKEGGK